LDPLAPRNLTVPSLTLVELVVELVVELLVQLVLI
jgi:hypothetical protein